jgi:K+-transporting ATPase KdpF subunit
VIAGFVAAGLLFYLTYALLRPERFQGVAVTLISDGSEPKPRNGAASKGRMMTIIGGIQILLFCAIVVALIKPLGWHMTRVFNGERTFLSPLLGPVEAALYWAGGVDKTREQHWLSYTIAMLFFHVGGFLILYGLMRTQALLPFNPAEQSAVAQDLSFNTAVSFITNTNWQNYGGESTMSYLVQMAGLTHQNFLSAATGIVIAVALIRATNNQGPHGFTEMLYLYVSSTANNGSAFAGISANTMFYNLTGAVAMLVGRFWMIIPAMAIAGSLAAKKTVPASAGTFPTTGGLFIGLVVGVIVIIGGLTFFPALSLGPIVEHLAMLAKATF